MGRRRRSNGRDVNGIVLLDKPAGITSNAALQRVKRLFNANKAGHTGSLDPIATGLLPICLGEATKISGYLLGADKVYKCCFKLGVQTDTGDAEGKITATDEVNSSDHQIEQVINQFQGVIEQMPPMYSAIKHKGQPLYKLARAGKTVEREPREVEIYSLSWTRLSVDEIAVELHCSSGFYVRVLAVDIGNQLGCGAHMSSLRRTQVHEFSLDHAVTPEQLEQASDPEALDTHLIPADQGLSHLPAVRISNNAAFYLCRGRPVKAAQTPNSGVVRVYGDELGFLGIGEVLDDGRVGPKRLFNQA